MKKVILFISMSFDGYIADKNGGVGWLEGHGGGEENIDTYSEFVKNVDTVVMGWNTYHQIVTELSPDEWVYGGLTAYVVTHREQVSTEKIRFTDMSPADLVRGLKKENGKDIWICGGADIVRQLVNKDMIDCYYITVISVILGSGVRLFENTERGVRLELLDTRSYNGMTELIYVRR